MVGDDLFGHGKVRAQQGLGRMLHRVRGQPTHLADLGGQCGQLLVEDSPHLVGLPFGYRNYLDTPARCSLTSDVSVTLLGPELRPVAVAWVLITRLECRSGRDGLGSRRDRRLHRGLNVRFGVGHGAGSNGGGAGSHSLNGGGTAGPVLLVVTTTAAT